MHSRGVLVRMLRIVYLYSIGIGAGLSKLDCLEMNGIHEMLRGCASLLLCLCGWIDGLIGGESVLICEDGKRGVCERCVRVEVFVVFGCICLYLPG